MTELADVPVFEMKDFISFGLIILGWIIVHFLTAYRENVKETRNLVRYRINETYSTLIAIKEKAYEAYCGEDCEARSKHNRDLRILIDRIKNQIFFLGQLKHEFKKIEDNELDTFIKTVTEVNGDLYETPNNTPLVYNDTQFKRIAAQSEILLKSLEKEFNNLYLKKI